MHTGSRRIAALSGGLAVLLAGAPIAAARQQSLLPDAQISLTPAGATAGSAFTITWSGFSRAGGKRLCGQIVFAFDETTVAIAGGGEATAPAASSTGAKVPASAALGGHKVTATCNSLELFDEAAFTVTKPPPDPPKPTTPVTTPPPVVPPVIVPPGQPPVTTRRPATTTTTTTTPTAPTAPTTSRPPKRTPETSAPQAIPPAALPPLSTADPRPMADGDLVLDRVTIGPGDPLTATGRGCTPGSPVTLTSHGERVGGTIADAQGKFTAAVRFTRLEAGRQWVTANCGVVLTAAVDQLLTSSSGGQSSSLIILVFFVFVGMTVLRFR